MFLIISAIFLLLFICFIFTNKNRTALLQFPNPPISFMFGNAYLFKNTTEILDRSAELFSIYGPNIRLVLGPPLFPVRIGLLTTDPDLIECILTSNKILKKAECYDYFKSWAGLGLLLSYGELWKKHRKIIAPAFHIDIMKTFVSIFESAGDVFVDKLKAYGDTPSVDLFPLAALCTLDIICESALGIKTNGQSKENEEYRRSAEEICQIFINKYTNVFKICLITFILTPDYYKQRRALKSAHNFIEKAINYKKEQMRNGHKSENRGKVPLLELLLELSENGKVLNDEEIRHQIHTFTFGGHDTSACTLSFTLYCLANHPEIQEKVLEEQKRLFGSEKNPTVTYQELQSMKYLEKVIKESLRLYPPVPLIGRHNLEDFEFKGHKIPKYTNIAISIYNLQRNSKYFPKPDKFDPDRFDNLDSIRPYTYIPFSAGPKNCLGQKYAMLELKSLISKVIRHFELIPAIPEHKLLLSMEVVLRSTNGIKVGLKKRV